MKNISEIFTNLNSNRNLFYYQFLRLCVLLVGKKMKQNETYKIRISSELSENSPYLKSYEFSIGEN